MRRREVSRQMNAGLSTRRPYQILAQNVQRMLTETFDRDNAIPQNVRSEQRCNGGAE